MHHVNSFFLNNLPDNARIAQPLPVAAVADAGPHQRGPGGQRVGIGHYPYLVALGAVGFGQLHGVGHRARKELSRKNVENAHGAKVLPS